MLNTQLDTFQIQVRYIVIALVHGEQRIEDVRHIKSMELKVKK